MAGYWSTALGETGKTAREVPMSLLPPNCTTRKQELLTPTMHQDRFLADTVPLRDGRILFVGGVVLPKGNPWESEDTATAEVHDPKTNQFVETGSMSTPRAGSAVALLRDGSVLVAGGARGSNPLEPGVGMNAVEIYEPTTGRFRPAGSLNRARAGSTAVPLSDGRILIVAGVSSATIPVLEPEIYDPQDGAFRVIDLKSIKGLPPELLRASAGAHTAIGLNDGRILFMADARVDHQWRGFVGIYDPADNGFISFDENAPLARNSFSATLLKNGRVLIAGGNDNDGTELADAELFTP
jgi:hypothetical protein